MEYRRYEFLMATVRGTVPGSTMAERLAAADKLIADRPGQREEIDRIFRFAGRHAAGETARDRHARGEG